MRLIHLAVLVSVLPSALQASAAVIQDRTRHTGPGAIDPAGAQTITASQLGGGATKAILEARDDFGVIQDWTGFTGWGNNPANTNILTFSNLIPHVEFRVNKISGADFSADYGSAVTSAQHATSSDSALRTGFNASTITSTHTLTISFGTYDGLNFLYDQAVEAAGFTLNNINGGTSAANRTRYQVEFQNAAGDPLFTSAWVDETTMPRDPADNRPNVFFAHMVAPSTLPEDWIARIVITEQRRGGTGSGNQMGFDDFGFTAQVVPEPSSWMLFAVSAAAMLMWQFRRTKASGAPNSRPVRPRPACRSR